jgi:FHA domain-containing protein
MRCCPGRIPSGESRTIIRPRGGDFAASANAPATPAAEELDLTLDFPAAAPVGGRSAAARAVPAAPPVPLQSAAAPGPTRGRHAVPAAASAARRSPTRHIAALTAALREGLGVPNLPADALVLTPALMRLMGRLVHEATRGTVDLLMARAALKREIRAEVTMIVSRENNPLKFSPSTEVALGHLLSPPARGFMEADKAMRDAYDDLRAHQFAFLAACGRRSKASSSGSTQRSSRPS